MAYQSAVILVVYFGLTGGNEEPAGTQCLSRFDYDFKMMEKIINLETQFQEMKKNFDEYFGLNLRNVNKKCKNGWVAYEGSCYLFGTDDLKFTVAEDYCRQRGGRLVHVETHEENLFLKGFMKDYSKGGHYWLGMTDEITEGLWTWHGTDQHIRYYDWGPSEPDAGNSQNCAVFLSAYQFEWVDVSCTAAVKALCEM